MQVHAETFKFSHTDDYGIDRHTVEVTINGQRRVIRAARHTYPNTGDTITVFDLAVKFQTGAKVWPGRVDFMVATGKIGRLDACIDKFTGKPLRLVGFFEDFEQSKARSLHNAVA